MFSKVYSVGILGVNGFLVSVEADVSDGLPCFSMVGYLASEVREAQDRVRTAFKNSGFLLPPKKITVNLSPADVRKEGTAFDLPIAVAVLASFGVIETEVLEDSIFVGELGLDGRIKPVRGVLSIVDAARGQGMHRCFLPRENVREGCVIPGIEIVGAGTIKELAELMRRPKLIRGEAPTGFGEDMDAGGCLCGIDYSEVSGQLALKRATEVAAAGLHNILYIGPAGAGKTMVARRIPTILPSLSMEERIEISKIYSICGLLSPDHPLLTERPFRSPHHTISPQALTGGGRIPKPGEISLASGGVLFLDELPEFSQNTLEVLRQPLEERKITIARVYGSYEYPARFMLAAAMNPCSCGFYPDRDKCRCTQARVDKYLSRISKPLLDRIDICVEAQTASYQEIRKSAPGERSASIRKRVEKARQIQRERFQGSGIFFNGRMGNREIARFCSLGKKEEEFLEQIYAALDLSARACGKILKVARTIADLEGREQIEENHLAEAAGYRSLKEKYWG